MHFTNLLCVILVHIVLIFCSLNKLLTPTQMDKFTINIDDVGDLQKLRLAQDGNGKNKSWFVSKVIVRNTYNGVSLEFPCDKWLSESEGDKKLYVDLIPRADQLASSQVALKKLKYKYVCVYGW